MRRARETPQLSCLADRGEGQLTTALLLLASILFLPGIFLPALQLQQLGFLTDTHSIAGLAASLVRQDAPLLAATVVLFSMVFPMTKLVWMWRLQFRRQDLTRPAHLDWLERLGKWSMADVLVVALMIFSLRGSLLLDAEPLPGIFVFAASTLLAMLASGRIVTQLRALRAQPEAT